MRWSKINTTLELQRPPALKTARPVPGSGSQPVALQPTFQFLAFAFQRPYFLRVHTSEQYWTDRTGCPMTVVCIPFWLRTTYRCCTTRFCSEVLNILVVRGNGKVGGCCMLLGTHLWALSGTLALNNPLFKWVLPSPIVLQNLLSPCWTLACMTRMSLHCLAQKSPWIPKQYSRQTPRSNGALPPVAWTVWFRQIPQHTLYKSLEDCRY